MPYDSSGHLVGIQCMLIASYTEYTNLQLCGTDTGSFAVPTETSESEYAHAMIRHWH